MNDFFNSSYCNRKNWILEHIKDASLTLEEAMVLLMIEFMNEQGYPISLKELASHLGCECQLVDGILSSLCDKHYLQITSSGKRIRFNIDGFFSLPAQETVEELPLFSVFEEEFARPLTARETMMLADWQKEWEPGMLLYALREATIYHKLSFSYIQAILADWKRRGITIQDLSQEKMQDEAD